MVARDADWLVKRDCWLGNGSNVCSQCISLQSASCPFFGGSTCAAGASKFSLDFIIYDDRRKVNDGCTESACEYGGCC